MLIFILVVFFHLFNARQRRLEGCSHVRSPTANGVREQKKMKLAVYVGGMQPRDSSIAI